MGTGSFPGVKRQGGGVDHPPTYSADVKERVVILLLHLWAFVVCSRMNSTFTFFTFYLSKPNATVLQTNFKSKYTGISDSRYKCNLMQEYEK